MEEKKATVSGIRSKARKVLSALVAATKDVLPANMLNWRSPDIAHCHRCRGQYMTPWAKETSRRHNEIGKSFNWKKFCSWGCEQESPVKGEDTMTRQRLRAAYLNDSYRKVTAPTASKDMLREKSRRERRAEARDRAREMWHSMQRKVAAVSA